MGSTVIDVMERQRAWLDLATRWLAIIGFAGLVVICLMTMYDGLARYLGMARIPGFRDFGEVIFAVLIASCFPAGLLHNQNITITFLGKALGPKVHAVLNLFSALVVLAGFIIICWALIDRTAGLGDRTTRTGYMVVAPWAWTATAIMLVTVPIQIWVTLARAIELRTGLKLVDDRGGSTEAGLEDLDLSQDEGDRRS